MAANWTKEQKKVIDLHDRNILVSAAAGSGKTAVLVERIIKMVTDEERNIDIDKLVVVTFTKAAAGEMKQRISDAIEQILEENPDDIRLQKQLTLINNAQITTIDSFCLNIIRNNFTSADIDPGFRTADEGELKLLESDVMGNVLEEYYQSEREDFFQLVNSYGNGKSDEQIEEIIRRVYQFSRSYPWPMEWLDECRQSYQINDESALNHNRAVEYLTDYVSNILSDYNQKYEKLLNICSESDGPYMYKPMIESDYASLTYILKKNTFEELAQAVNNVKFDRMSSKKDENVDEAKKEIVKAARNQYKKTITDLQKKIFRQTMEQNLEDLRINLSSINVLIEVVERFYLEMKRVKREKNIIDFNDMEHLALDILVKKEDGVLHYTDVADRLSEYYHEILIDEYQDSNLLQEQILSSISRGRKNEDENNMFMVGDVKQSIYKFRLARPDLFIGKYNTYTDEDSKNQKIELRMNFRSRDHVLKSINDVFFQVMKAYFGGIEYNEHVMLNTGLKFEEPDPQDCDRIANSTDIYVIQTESDESENSVFHKKADYTGNDSVDEDAAEQSDRELEASFIADKIHDLTSPEHGMKVFDKKLGEYRLLELRDIVILTRTVSGWADTFVNVLMSKGIPAFSDSSSGYFNTREVKMILSFLAVIDNPIQDIPLAAVLTSYFGNLTTEELALLRVPDKNQKLFASLAAFEENQDLKPGTREKIRTFLALMTRFRDMAVYIDIHELIWKAVYETGFYAYVGTMPAGEKRQANLDVLIEKAKKYEATSYKGLFNFLRYIEKLKKYDIDYGEASLLGENENLVRVMSIHKSKGLEFPVVFLAGMSKRFNHMDAANAVVVDPELGIAANAVNLESRTRIPTIMKTAISTKIKIDNLCEELRILYVAMTRAKEKLIMTGTVKNVQKNMDKWKTLSLDIQDSGRGYSYADLEGCGNYFDMVVPTALKEYGNTGRFIVETLDPSEIVAPSELTDSDSQTEEAEMLVSGEDGKETEENAKANDEKENSAVSETKINTDTTKAEEFREQAEAEQQKDTQAEKDKQQNFCEPYPYQRAASMKGKMTVSELKQSQIDLMVQSDETFLQEEYEDSLEKILSRTNLDEELQEKMGEGDESEDPESTNAGKIDKSQESAEIIPHFISGEEPMIGADRGTAYHRVMECLDYQCIHSLKDVTEYLKTLVEQRKITHQQYYAIDARKVWKFVQSDIGKRINEQFTDTLRREQPFVYGTEIDGETILVQGVIDLYFEENDELVIVDYKTDYVTDEQVLIDRYQIQLEYYANALQQVTGKKVKEKIIYSFRLDKQIVL